MTRLDETCTDLLGREIQVGDIVAYPVTVSRSAAMRIGRVVELLHPKDWEGKTVENKVSMRLEYLGESMDWGIYKRDPEWDVPYHTARLAEEPDFEAIAAKPWTDHDPDRHWLEFRYHRGQYIAQTSPTEATAAYRTYHERELARAEKVLAAAPKPDIKTVLFPGKSIVLNNEYASLALSRPD